MKYNLKLDKHEETFAIKYITDYYSYCSQCKYSNLINSILDKFENNITDYNQLKSKDDWENVIVKKLLSVFIDKLNDENENNPTGLFGVKRAFFSDGANLFYKNLIKDEFVKAKPIYAHTFEELKTKVKLDKGVWLVFNQKKYVNLSFNIIKSTRRLVKKSSKSFSGSKKTGGFPCPLYSSSLANSVHNHYGRQ